MRRDSRVKLLKMRHFTRDVTFGSGCLTKRFCQFRRNQHRANGARSFLNEGKKRLAFELSAAK